MQNLKKILSILVVCAFSLGMMAQNRGFNFQAVARDADGNMLSGALLQVKTGIVDPADGGTLIWQEQHNDKMTGSDGSFDLVIGDPMAEKTGGTAAIFKEIDWTTGDYELNIQVNPGNGFIDLGNTPLNAVPYAKVSENIYPPLPSFVIQSKGEAVGEALFEVRNKNGDPVFAVYEDSVWVYTHSDGAKGFKGGFAVGGYRKSSKGDVVEQYMRVTPDSVRIYIDNEQVKGVKGGFAVGGYRKSSKGDGPSYISVDSDSVRIFTGFTPSKSSRGGFGLSGYDYETGEIITYMTLSPENSFIGSGSGLSHVDGKYNTFIGYKAGLNHIAGDNNIFMGYLAGRDNIGGSNNIFLGTGSGRNNKSGTGNVFLGYNSGYNIEGNNLLVIENSDKDNTGAMFYGDFNRDILRINASMGIRVDPDTGYAIKTDRTVLADIESPSDLRYKTNIETLDDALSLVSSLRGVSFDWNQSAFPEKHFESGRQIGFIAQEMEMVIPEFVSTGGDGYKAVSYQKMTAVLVEAIKEQQKMILERDEKISDLEQRIAKIEAVILKNQ
jgi:hypothetical protein